MAQTFRFSTFNCENLFSRPWAMNLETWEDGREILTDIQRLNSLIAEPVYTDAMKAEMIGILTKYSFNNTNMKASTRPFVINNVRGKLFTVSRDAARTIKIPVDGRDDWIGWIELSREDVSGIQVENTGRVIKKVNADVQLMVEVEDRLALAKFNRQVLENVLGMPPYPHNLLIDGNDDRGIDLGLLSRFPILSVSSYISEGGLDKPLFSRDCPVYVVDVPELGKVYVLGNHFKSKGYGNQDENNSKRKAQAKKVQEIYNEIRDRSLYVIVAGDLNDYPGSDPLTPLLNDTDLKEVMSHSSYSGLPGTYDTCTSKEKKIDYVLLSPALWSRVNAVGVERSGIWAPRAFKAAGIEIMPTVTSDRNSASDHALVWVDIEL